MLFRRTSRIWEFFANKSICSCPSILLCSKKADSLSQLRPVAENAKGERDMTEYNVAIPVVPTGYKIQPETIGAVSQRGISSEEGVYKSLQESFEQFETELDTDHEIALRLVSFGKEIDFRPEKIGFTVPNLITFSGVTDFGERVQLVQHVSQLNYMLRAVKKLHDQPARIAFQR